MDEFIKYCKIQIRALEKQKLLYGLSYTNTRRLQKRKKALAQLLESQNKQKEKENKSE